MEKTFPKLKPEELSKQELLGLLGLFDDEGFLAIERNGVLFEICKKELRDFYEKQPNSFKNH